MGNEINGRELDNYIESENPAYIEPHPFKCKRCKETCKPTEGLSSIWDVYEKAKLCPDCSDLLTRNKVFPQIHRAIKI